MVYGNLTASNLNKWSKSKEGERIFHEELKPECINSIQNPLSCDYIIYDNHSTIILPEIAEFYNFHQRNSTSQHSALLHLIYSVITLKNWSFTFLLYYHRLKDVH